MERASRKDIEEMSSEVLSIILLAFYSGQRLKKVVGELLPLLHKQSVPFELIIIDDGSKDDTFKIAQELDREYEVIRAFRLSRNYTSHYAAFAGLTVAKGGCAALIPDDGQQPYETLVAAYRLWENGAKIVLPYRQKRKEPWTVKFWSVVFYWLLNIGSDTKVPRLGLDTWFVDREVMDILNSRISPIRTTTISEILRLGFDPIYLPYERQGRPGKSRWTVRKKLRLATDWFFSTSDILIKAIIWGGGVAIGVSILVSLLYVSLYFVGWDFAEQLHENPGWTSLFVLGNLSLGLILLATAVNAHYLLRIYDEVKSRPGFIIRNP